MFSVNFFRNPETGKSVKVMTPIKNEEEFRTLRNSERNIKALNDVRAKYQIYQRMASDGADEAALGKLKDEIKTMKNRLIQFNYSCIPNEDMRLAGSTLCSPLVGMDVDFDVTDPDFDRKMAEAPERIISMEKELGLMMFERSAGKGYHIVFKRHLDMTQEENLRWASNLIGCQYDEGAKDITRVFYASSASADDLLFVNPELFSEEMNRPVEVNVVQTATAKVMPKVETTSTLQVAQKMEQTSTADAKILCYEGIPYSEIISKYWELFNDGKTPTEGNRNSLTFELVSNIRCIADYDENLLMSIVPQYDGFEKEEWKKTIFNANSQPRKGLTYRIRQVLIKLKAQKKTGMPFGMNPQTPPVYDGNLPVALRKITALVPHHLKTTVSEGVFGALATHLHGVTFIQDDGAVVEPAIMQVIIFRQSRGKGSVDKPIECIMEDIVERDAISREREDTYKRNNPTSKKKEERPAEICIQSLSTDITNAALVMRLTDANRNGQKPLFMHMQEFDEILALQTNGKQDISKIIRKAFDRKPYGQERVGSDSVTGVAPLRLNFTAATTPTRAKKMLTPWVSDGTLSRLNLITIDEGPKPKYKPVTKKYKDDIAPFIERLNNASGLIRCRQAEKLAGRLQQQIDDEVARCDSDALDTFAARAISIAYFKAMILYIMQGKWNKDIELYMEWSLKRDLWMKLNFFGQKLEDELKQESSMKNYQSKNILEYLPKQPGGFTTEEFKQIREKVGGYVPDYKGHLKKLKQRSQVYFDETTEMWYVA